MAVPLESAPATRKSRVARVIALVVGGAVACASLGGIGFLGFQAGQGGGVSIEPDMPLVIEAQPDEARPTPATPVAATRLPTCSLGDLPLDPRLGTLTGVVVDPWSGEVVFDQGGQEPVAPASVLKIITAAAAVTVLGPDRTFRTEVRQGGDPTQVFLVAGGDPTLTQEADSSQSVYRDGASLEALALQTMETLTAASDGEAPSISKVVIDTTVWDQNDSWDESWAASARSNGYLSRVHPLQLDGDRVNAAVAMSPRGNNPSLRAANAFVAELKAAGNSARQVSVSFAARDEDAEVVGFVESAPVSVWVEYLLKESDNTLAEVLARHISLELGFDGSAASINEAMVVALQDFGLDSEGVTIRDGSGLSALNQVTPGYVTSLVADIFQSQGPLGDLREALPLAGIDGSLDDRFVGDNSVAAGQVSAKTGSISGTRSLAGFLQSEDTANLVFAFFATGDVDDAARGALESLVTGVFACGSNLADF
ncbi:D-alanyl-D-alanine carboxypeptidase/D-alanyl-D-alanine-endopeptidase [Pontimonas sp.]|nr:D-alanyl-D-alanine carboxypeptidase/D-alanyl-D-alanine-endopeptidase [Pontimonas sp.]